MRTLALAIVAASLVLALGCAASAATVELICRGTATADGQMDHGVRFHARLDTTAQTICFGDCNEQLRLTSVSGGVYRYEAGGPEPKSFEVRLQPDMAYRSRNFPDCRDCVVGAGWREAGGCRNALVRGLIDAISPPKAPWPDEH
jgi:hypothetical protein